MCKRMIIVAIACLTGRAIAAIVSAPNSSGDKAEQRNERATDKVHVPKVTPDRPLGDLIIVKHFLHQVWPDVNLVGYSRSITEKLAVSFNHIDLDRMRMPHGVSDSRHSMRL
jgi:hypothetical protein